MTETKDPGNKPSGGGRAGKTMTLSMQRTVEKGHVRQSFSHGRSKSVIVETRKKRTIAPPGHAPAAAEAAPAPKPETARPGQPQRSAPPAARKAPDMPRGLSSEEQQARNRALAAFRVRDEQETQLRAEAELRAREAQARQEAEEQARRTAEEAERAAREAESRMSVQAEAPVAEAPAPAPAAPPVAEIRPQPSSDRPFGPVIRKPVERPAPVARPDAAAPADTTAERRPATVARRERTVEVEDSDDSPGRKRGVPGKKVAPERTPPVKRADDRRSTRGRLTIANALDDQQRERSLSALKRRQERAKAKISGAGQVRDKIQREVVIPEAISIQELSNRMAERAVDIIKFLMKQGEMHKITDVIDGDTAELIVTELGHIPKRVSEADVEEGFIGSEDSLEEQTSRAPIVTIMGHVDHGKTSLLDAIRHANVAAGEAGGITQHIGAYQVETPSGQRVTFIDTPGHEAFTAMRARGAKVTDIVILVVAADDGVMPQTVEAINHAKSAGVPMIVAINKIDKPSADPSRVRTDLLKYEVVVESMSGEVLEVEVSALKRINLDKLLEAIALQSEVLELKANPNRSAEGVVIEAKLEAGRGPVGTVLIQRGTLKVGDIIVAGSAWGRVRALISDRGDPVTSAGPSVPVEVLGFSSAPEAGDQLAVVENEARAREITDYRVRKRRDRQAAGAGSMRTLEQMMNQLKGEGRKEFPLLVKGDVQGSVEAINAALEKLGTSEVGARIIHSAVGGITESDISLASASGAVVVGFNVRANAQARAAAERDGVQIRYYNIIYDLVDDVKKAMSGLLAPTVREIFLGNAEILEVFNITKVGKVAGCRVTEGKVERGARVRLIRDNTVIHEGKLSTLKRFKDEVREVPVGQECGMAFENYQDMRQGDVIECFNVETVARSL